MTPLELYERIRELEEHAEEMGLTLTRDALQIAAIVHMRSFERFVEAPDDASKRTG
jgi:hypothetical protein